MPAVVLLVVSGVVALAPDSLIDESVVVALLVVSASGFMTVPDVSSGVSVIPEVVVFASYNESEFVPEPIAEPESVIPSPVVPISVVVPSVVPLEVEEVSTAFGEVTVVDES